MPVRLGVVGVGKIVRDQHLPVLADHPGFELLAAASRNATVDGVANFETVQAMLDDGPALDAVALCTPPHARHAAARAALARDKHVLLEKPPGATLGEVDDLATLAAARGVTLYTGWHSRHAPAVEPAKALLADVTIRSVDVQWREDVRKWHPGQAWIWQPGGFGVFDPGINALSIVTNILPRPFFLRRATLAFPANRAAPIAADLAFEDAAGVPVTATFDWRETGEETWTVRVETDAGTVTLTHGGSRMFRNGTELAAAPEAEYRAIYDRFADLIARAGSDIDVAPLRHVADAYLIGERRTVAAFED